MEDTDETIPQGPQCLVVEVSCLSSLVVEGPASGTVRQRAERPLVDRVVESAVANVAGQDGSFLA